MELSRYENDETPKAATSGVFNLSVTPKELTNMSIATQISTINVPFNDQLIPTVSYEHQTFVAMRPIAENIGVDWSGQMAKLKNQREKFGCRDISTPTNGGIQNMLCIPLRKLNGWLFSINPEKVRADIRDKLIQYQEECFTVLHNYWTKGESVNPRKKTTVDDRTPLRDAVNMLVSKKHLLYPEAYTMIHQRFSVESIDELNAEQIPLAVEYIHRIVLEGEYIGKDDQQNALAPLSYQVLCRVENGKQVKIKMFGLDKTVDDVDSWQIWMKHKGAVFLFDDKQKREFVRDQVNRYLN